MSAPAAPRRPPRRAAGLYRRVPSRPRSPARRFSAAWALDGPTGPDADGARTLRVGRRRRRRNDELVSSPRRDAMKPRRRGIGGARRNTSATDFPTPVVSSAIALAGLLVGVHHVVDAQGRRRTTLAGHRVVALARRGVQQLAPITSARLMAAPGNPPVETVASTAPWPGSLVCSRQRPRIVSASAPYL